MSAGGSGWGLVIGRATFRIRIQQEPIGQRRLGVLRVDLDLVRPVADETHVEDEVRICSARPASDEPGLVDEAGKVELDPFEPRLADPLALDRRLAAASSRVTISASPAVSRSTSTSSGAPLAPQLTVAARPVAAACGPPIAR